MIDTITKKDCTGCKMCKDICPVEAIMFETDFEGFWYPKVDYSKCIKCELCVKKCPPLSNNNPSKNTTTSIDVFATWSKNQELRIDSTSGGIFSELSQVVINNGGYVVGVAFNEDLMVEHIVIDSLNDIRRVRRSKYLQSDTENIYKKTKTLLVKNKKVLFSGNPCQSAGLLSYLGKEYDNLYTVDFICKGNLSPKAFTKYKELLEKKYNSKIKEVHFKNKTIGWNNFGTKITFQNGEIYFKDRDNDLYMVSYLKHNLFLRPSCYECKFKEKLRVSDITFGDFWGVGENVDKTLDDNKGTSVVMINNQKGAKLFDEIKGNLHYVKVDIEDVYKGNDCLFNSAQKGRRRDIVFANIDKYPFDKLIIKYAERDIRKNLSDLAFKIMLRLKIKR